MDARHTVICHWPKKTGHTQSEYNDTNKRKKNCTNYGLFLAPSSFVKKCCEGATCDRRQHVNLKKTMPVIPKI